MFKVRGQKDNISEYKIYNDEVVFKNKKSLFEKSLYIGKLEINETKTTGFQVVGDSVIFSNWENETFNYDIKSKTKVKLNFQQIGVNLFNNKPLYRNESNYFLENKKGGVIIIPDEFIDGVVFIDNNELYNCSTSHLQAFSLPQAAPKWQFDLAELGTWLYDKTEERPYEIDKFIGVWENQLLVSCFSGLIIALDIATGQLLHQWSAYDAPSVMGVYSESHINPSFCSALDAANNTLVGFSRFTMWHIDLSTGQLGTVNLAKAFEKENILAIKRTSGFVLTSSHYIITAEMNDIADVDYRLDCLIAIHKETHNIDWIHPFSDSEGLANNVPQYANGKLYQLDRDNTLHIFEKENHI